MSLLLTERVSLTLPRTPGRGGSREKSADKADPGLPGPIGHLPEWPDIYFSWKRIGDRPCSDRCTALCAGRGIAGAGRKGVDSDVESTGVGFFARLVKRKGGSPGSPPDIAGFVVQAAALAVGSLLLVQPLLVTTLSSRFPLAAYVHKRRLTRREWFWAVVQQCRVDRLHGPQPARGRYRSHPGQAWIIPIAILVP